MQINNKQTICNKDFFFFLVPFDTWIYGNVILDLTFESQLSDPTSTEFQSLKMEIGGPLQNLFCRSFPCCSVSINGFRHGSTIAEFLVAIARGALSDCDITQRLISQMNSLPLTIGTIFVEPGRFSAGKLVCCFLTLS